MFVLLFALYTENWKCKTNCFWIFKTFRNEEPHVKKRMGKHGEKVDLILRVDLVSFSVWKLLFLDMRSKGKHFVHSASTQNQRLVGIQSKTLDLQWSNSSKPHVLVANLISYTVCSDNWICQWYGINNETGFIIFLFFLHLT